MKEKLVKLISVKTIITFVALALWITLTIYGIKNGQFETVFDFFKTEFGIVLAFFFGTQFSKTEK